MDSSPQSLSPDNPDAKPSFRKRSNHAASRKYRRHSPMNRSSSSDGGLEHDRSPSLDVSRDDSAKASEDRWRKKNDGRELRRESDRVRSDKGGGDSFRYSEKQTIGSSHHHRKHDDYSRHHRHGNEGGRSYDRSCHPGRESRGDDRRRESKHIRSRDYSLDKHIQDIPYNKEVRGKDKDRDSVVLKHQKHRDSSDGAISGRGRSNSAVDEIRTGERSSHKRSSGDYRDSDTFSNEEFKDRGRDSPTCRGIRGSRLKGTPTGNTKVPTGEDNVLDKKHEDMASGRHVERYKRELDENDYKRSSNFRKRDWRGEQKEDESSHVREDHDSTAKKLKMVVPDKCRAYGEDGCSSLKSTSRAEEKLLSSSKQVQGAASAVNSEQVQSSGNETEGAQDLNAAKFAAMKAAELVNLNLKGSGYMSTDQKKKLLWGSKKNAAAEESGNRWDTSLFPDKERQEKFYKLMGVKGDLKTEHKPNNKDGAGVLQAEKQQELQMDLEKQYTAGLRRRDGRTVGLGL